MERVQPRTLSGFQELLPARQTQMERMMQILRDTFSLYGFTPLDTPLIEAAEVLLAKGGGDTEKQIYRLTRGGAELALRFDLTVPLAKYVALNYGQLSFPFRRYQIGKVYRGERAQRGRFREFYQADIDVIGDGMLGVVNEAEMPAVICRVFTELGLRRFTIRVNNRKILNGFFQILSQTDNAALIMREIDKLDKQGADTTRENIAALTGAEDVADKLMAFAAISGTYQEKLAELKGYLGQNPVFDEGLSELETVTALLPEFGVPAENFDIDLSIARGLDYYTGTVYETTVWDHPEIGSICSGGRYDDLAGYYTDKRLPGVGISIGLSRLFFVLEEQGYLDGGGMVTAPADVLILPMTDNFAYAVSAATMLRDAGIRTQIHSEKKKFKAKIGYADKLGIPFAVFIGEDEISAAVLTVKELATGEQFTDKPEKAVQVIREKLAALNSGTVISESGRRSDT